ncbi:MAG TPA: hypothetical protein VNR11_15445 [Xanthobacteraceae bacterium]|nr:hypothetical protein [Xanthobacteraceae bacterium]
MFIPDPLLEEAAFLAAAVREGSLSAREIAERVAERAQETWRPIDAAALLRRAAVLDGPGDRGGSLRGVPFVVAGAPSPQAIAALARAGAVEVTLLAPDAAGLSEAASAVVHGVAAIALAAARTDELVGCGVHALAIAGHEAALLARTSRDLALAADAVASGGADAGDALCRRLTDSVGQGAGALRIAVVGEVALGGGRPSLAFERIEAADAALLARYDAVVARAAHGGAAHLYMSPTAPGAADGLCVSARSAAVAVRIGAVLDAERLVG